jgi:hypothetical protein
LDDELDEIHPVVVARRNYQNCCKVGQNFEIILTYEFSFYFYNNNNYCAEAELFLEFERGR